MHLRMHLLRASRVWGGCVAQFVGMAFALSPTLAIVFASSPEQTALSVILFRKYWVRRAQKDLSERLIIHLVIQEILNGDRPRRNEDCCGKRSEVR